MREALTYAESTSYDCIFMSNQIYLKKCGSIHVFVPFYTNYSPSIYQRSPIDPETRKQLFLGETNYSIGKYNISSLDERRPFDKKCLYILHPEEVKALVEKGYDLKEIHVVKDSRGVEYLKLIEFNRSS